MRTVFMLALSFEVWLALVLACDAKEFTVTDADQANVAFICDQAAISPNINRRDRLGVAQFCVQWEDRMKAANLPVPPEEKTKDSADPK